MDERRLMIVPVAYEVGMGWEALVPLLRSHGLPAGCKIVRVQTNFECGTVDYCVSHPSFPLSLPGQEIPRWCPPGGEWGAAEEPVVIHTEGR